MRKLTISRNISLLMDRFSIKRESELAKMTGIPQTTINKLISGVTEDPRISTLLILAEHFNIPLNDLVSEQPSFLKKEDAIHYTHDIPLIMYSELYDVYKNIASFDLDNWPSWYPVKDKKTESCYALDINTNSLPQLFEKASILIISREKPYDSAYCVVKHSNSSTINIKKFLIDGDKNWLLSLEEGIPSSLFDEDWKLLGIVKTQIINMSS